MATLYLIQYCAEPGLCLEASSPAINAFVQLSFISTFRSGMVAATDRWILDDGCICFADAPEFVIGVAGLEIMDGAPLLLGQKLPGRQVFQRWDWTTPPCIKNVLSPGYVIDCIDGQPGTDVKIRPSSGAPTQQWMLTPL
jgi:hypothetical protein